MSQKIIDINELTDSRELLEKAPPKFIIGFIYIFLAILFALILWAHFGEKEVVVKAQGVVQAVDANRIKTSIGGQISRIHVEEGDYVEVGDPLVSIDETSLEKEHESIEEKISTTNQEIELLEKYENSINKNTNLFSKTKEQEKEYYYKYANYQNQLKENNNTSSQEQIRAEGFRTSLDNYKKEKSSLEEQKQKLEQENKSLAARNNELISSNTSLQEQIDVIKSDGKLTEKEKNAQILEQENEITNNKNIISENEMKISENKQLIEGLNNEIKLQKSNIQNDEQSIKISEKTLQNYGTNASSYKNNELIQIQTQKKQLQEQLKEYTFQLENTKLQLENYTIKAEMDGQVHFITPINENELIQAGTDIVKINSGKDERLIVQLLIPSTEIANIKQGQEIKLHSYSLPYREYGFIQGKIKELDIDSTTIQDSDSYYMAKATLNKTSLQNSEGEKANLKTGMSMEGKIIVDQKSYLQLFLEKLDLWIKN